MMKNLALFAVIVAAMLFFAGCPQQQAPPAPAPEPQAPPQCAGTGADYCNGGELMNNARCVQGTWQYSSEVCANGCGAGKCKEVEQPATPEPTTPVEPVTPSEPGLLDCDDKNVCTQDGFIEDRCMNVPVVDGTACGDGMECVTGECMVASPAPPVEPAVPATPAFEPVAPTAAEMNKLLACGSSFSDKYYRAKITESSGTTRFELKLSNSIQTNYMQTNLEYRDLPSLEYSKVVVGDYRSIGSCACTARQLLVSYKAYGSRASGDTAEGGTCGTAPAPIIQASMLYDNIDASKIMNVGTELVSFAGYGGYATHFYQESTAQDGTLIKTSYYLADILPITVMMNGTAYYKDGTSKQFELELLP